MQKTKTYIKNKWIIADDKFFDFYEYILESKEGGIIYPSLQMASKQNWTTKGISRTNDLSDLAHDIEIGKSIAVSDGSYDPGTNICSAALAI